MARRARVVLAALALVAAAAAILVALRFGARERAVTVGGDDQARAKPWLYRDEPRTEGASIDGTVTSADGRPVDGAIVVLVRAPLANEAWYGVFQPAAQAISAG